MDINIQIISLSPVTKDEKGTPRITVTFLRDGETKSRNLVGYGKTKNAINQLAKLQPGDYAIVTIEKNGEYWNWEYVKKVDAVQATTTAAAAQAVPTNQNVPPQAQETKTYTKSNYETAEERAKKQVYIIRQSSITNAVATLTAVKGKFTSLDVIAVADEYVQYVLNGLPKNEDAEDVVPTGAPNDANFEDDLAF